MGGGVGRSSPSMAFMRSSAAGRIVRWFVLVFGAKWLSAGSIRVAGATMHLWGKICNFALVDNITGPQQTYLCIG